MVCYILSFIVHATFGKFLAASADFDAQMQESNAGERTMNRANRDHILWSVQLKLGEFSRSIFFICSALRFSQFMDASTDLDAPMQESKQGTVIIERVFCKVVYRQSECQVDCDLWQ